MQLTAGEWESAAHRQAGHCYLAGRSKLSPRISTARSEESTSHQRIFARPRVQKGILRMSRVYSLQFQLIRGVKEFTIINKGFFYRVVLLRAHSCSSSSAGKSVCL